VIHVSEQLVKRELCGPGCCEHKTLRWIMCKREREQRVAEYSVFLSSPLYLYVCMYVLEASCPEKQM